MTLNYILMGGVVLLYAYFRYHTLKKDKDELDLIDLSKYKKISFFKTAVPLISILLVVSILGVVVSFTDKNELLRIVSIAMIIISIIEFIYAYKAMVFYYGEDKCIIQNKPVQYKFIRYCIPKTRLPFSRGSVELYSGERKVVYNGAIKYIQEKIKTNDQEKQITNK